MKAHNLEKEEQIIHRKGTVINATVENSVINPGQVYSQDLMIEIPSNVPGTIRHGQHIGRHYELNLDIELSIQGTLTLTAPILLLEWSPQLKGIVPDVVPISIRKIEEEVYDLGDEENKPLLQFFLLKWVLRLVLFL